jgi:hypothetical protein
MYYGVTMHPYTYSGLRVHLELRVTRLLRWAGVYESHDARMLHARLHSPML